MWGRILSRAGWLGTGRCCPGVAESPSREVFGMSGLGMGFGGGTQWVSLVVGLDDLEGPFQPMITC